MGRRSSKGRKISGVLLLDKPAGDSSNWILQKVKRLYQANKAGHTGSLDPLATGMLPICFGEATKTSSFLLDANKHYRVTGKLGAATETGDEEGEVVQNCSPPDLSEDYINEILAGFVGQIEQVPPMYSALKYQGQRLYEIARAGKTVDRPARKITIYKLTLVAFNKDTIELDVSCSKGTYIRTLIEDIAQKMGSCAHVKRLHRTGVDPFDQDKLVSVEQLELLAEQGLEALDALLLPADSGLLHWPEVALSKSESTAILYGQPVSIDNPSSEGWVRMYTGNRKFLGIGQIDQNIIRPKRLFVSE